MLANLVENPVVDNVQRDLLNNERDDVRARFLDNNGNIKFEALPDDLHPIHYNNGYFEVRHLYIRQEFPGRHPTYELIPEVRLMKQQRQNRM